MCPDQRVLDIDAVLTKSGRLVHGVAFDLVAAG
jgi:hypothetical protein